MTVRFTHTAEQDLVEAQIWYRRQARGLHHEFIRTLASELAAIERLPESRPIVHRDVRRAMMRRFPYGIFYVFDEGGVVVLAVYHAARDPRTLRRRIGD